MPATTASTNANILTIGLAKGFPTPPLASTLSTPEFSSSTSTLSSTKSSLSSINGGVSTGLDLGLGLQFESSGTSTELNRDHSLRPDSSCRLREPAKSSEKTMPNSTSSENSSLAARRNIRKIVPANSTPSTSSSSRENSQERGVPLAVPQTSNLGSGKASLLNMNLNFPLSPPLTGTASQFSTSPKDSAHPRCGSAMSIRAKDTTVVGQMGSTMRTLSPAGRRPASRNGNSSNLNGSSRLNSIASNATSASANSGRFTPIPNASSRSVSRTEFHKPSLSSLSVRDTNRSSTFSTLSGISHLSSESTNSVNQYRTLLEYERQGMKIERELWEEERRVMVENVNTLREENERLRRMIEELMGEKEKEKESRTVAVSAPVAAINQKDEFREWARRKLESQLNGPRSASTERRSMCAIHPASSDAEDLRLRDNNRSRPDTAASNKSEQPKTVEKDIGVEAATDASMSNTAVSGSSASTIGHGRSRSNSANTTRTTHTIGVTMELPISFLYDDPQTPQCPPLASAAFPPPTTGLQSPPPPSPLKPECMSLSPPPRLAASSASSSNAAVTPSLSNSLQKKSSHRPRDSDLNGRTTAGFFTIIRRDPVTGQLLRCSTKHPNSSNTSLASSITTPRSPFYPDDDDQAISSSDSSARQPKSNHPNRRSRSTNNAEICERKPAPSTFGKASGGAKERPVSTISTSTISVHFSATTAAEKSTLEYRNTMISDVLDGLQLSDLDYLNLMDEGDLDDAFGRIEPTDGKDLPAVPVGLIDAANLPPRPPSSSSSTCSDLSDEGSFSSTTSSLTSPRTRVRNTVNKKLGTGGLSLIPPIPKPSKSDKILGRVPLQTVDQVAGQGGTINPSSSFEAWSKTGDGKGFGGSSGGGWFRHKAWGRA